MLKPDLQPILSDLDGLVASGMLLPKFEQSDRIQC